MNTNTTSLYQSPYFYCDMIPKIEGEIGRSYIFDDLFCIVDTLINCICIYMTYSIVILVMPIIWIYRHHNYPSIQTSLPQGIGK